MTFKPPNSTLTTEELLETETGGFSFSDSTLMSIQDSAVRLVPQFTTLYPIGVQWPTVIWTEQDELLPGPGYIEDRWDSTFNNFTATDPIQFPFDLQRIYLKFDTKTSEYFWIEQTGIPTDTFTGVDNASGYTLQLKLQVLETDTSSWIQGHSLAIDDGVQSIELYFVETGIGIRDNTGVFLSTDLKSSPREIRVAAKQDDIYLLLDDGHGYAGINTFTGTSSGTKKLQFGAIDTGLTGAGIDGLTVLDYVYQFHSGLVTDSGLALVPVYTTGQETVTTPAFTPATQVEEFSAAYFDLSGDTGNGTTSVKAQYNSSTVSTWTDFGSFTTLDTLPRHELLLDNIPTAGDGTDSLRFVIRQNSADGSAEPARVERITVQSLFTDANLRGFPRWGPTQGGNTIALELMSSRGLNKKALPNANTVALYPFDETGGTDVLDITINDNTGTYIGNATLGVTGSLGTQVQLSNVTLDTSSNLENVFDGTYIVTGMPAVGGEIGSGFTPVKDPLALAAGLFFEIVPDFTNPAPDNMIGTPIQAQKMYMGLTGYGLEVSNYTANTNGRKVINFRLQIERGTAKIRSYSNAGDDAFHYAFPYDYKGVKEFRFVTHPMVTTDTSTLEITNAANVIGQFSAIFTVSDFHLSDLDTGMININTISGYEIPVTSGDPSSGWGVDIFVTPYAYNLAETGSVLMDLSGAADRVLLSMNEHGYPVADVTTLAGAVSVTGNWPLLLDERKNIAVTHYNRTGSTDGYTAILVDGEINGLVRGNTAGDSVRLTGGQITIGADAASGKSYYGLVDQFRIQKSPLKPEFHAQRLGITDVLFRDVLEVPGFMGSGTGTSFRTVSLHHFNEPSGPLVDDSEFWGVPASEAIIPHEVRRYVARGEQGVIGGGVSFSQAAYRQGGFTIPHNNDLNSGVSAQQFSMFFYFGGYTDSGQDSPILEYLSDDNYGFTVAVDTGGRLLTETFTGTYGAPALSHIHTGALIGTNKFIACGVAIDPLTTGITTYIDTTTESSTGTINFDDYLQGSIYSEVKVGYRKSIVSPFVPYGVVGTIDQLHLFHGKLDQSTFDTWRVPNKVKGIPDNVVFVGGTQLSSKRVLPVNPRKLYVIMPEGSAGETHIYANISGVSISMTRPYKYVQGYSREIDFSQIEDAVCRTKSPFRIGDMVPDGAVNLASIQSPELTIPANMSEINLADRELANISNHLRGQFTLVNPDTGGSAVVYSNQIDTQEIVLSNRSVARRDFTEPAPLFYKYLIGRGRYYLKHEGAAVTDVEMIRSAIDIIDDKGYPVSISAYPWDVEVSTLDINGNPLPTDIFSVVVYTNRLFRPDASVFVRYHAVDKIQNFKDLVGHREVINPVPIFFGDNSSGIDTFALTFTNTGTYNIDITTG